MQTQLKVQLLVSESLLEYFIKLLMFSSKQYLFFKIIKTPQWGIIQRWTVLVEEILTIACGLWYAI